MRTLLVIALALAAPAAALFVATRDLPDLEMRPAGAPASPWIGSLGDGSLPRQRFRTRSDGLWRIDVALAASKDAQDVRLELRDGDRVLRTAEGRFGQDRGLNFGFTTFEFEPVADSGGRELEFALVPGPASDGPRQAVVRMRPRRLQGGRPYPLGREAVVERAEGRFLSTRDQLTALCFFAAELRPGTARLELRDDEADGALVRAVEYEVAAGQRYGTLWIPFEPLGGSREHVYRWSLEPPPGSRLWVRPVDSGAGREVFTTQPGHYHGAERDDPWLLGASGLGWPAGEADIVFATYARGRDPWADLRERLGPRLPLALLAWVAACLALDRALRALRGPAGPQNAK